MVDPGLLEPYQTIPAFKRSLRLVLRRPSVFVVFIALGAIPVAAFFMLGLDELFDMLSTLSVDRPLLPLEQEQLRAFITPFLILFGIAFAAYALSIWIAVYAYTLDGVGYAAPYSKVIGDVLRSLPALVVACVLATLAVSLGTLLLIVPGVILMLVFWLVIPCAVVERVGPITALKRSAELTRGCRGQILAVMVLQWVVSAIASVAISAVFFPTIADQMLNSATDNSGMILAGNLLSVGFNIFFTAWFCAAVAYTYGNLRTLKEGPP
ncbi:MAG: hypothetical protein KDA49_16910 [Rhodospirillaceae bacterium]|nr:hypothetical protein [Rhodospirillaceae bacterium]MCA8934160.1 hypothetical protein [Rhodospirillaceae bacterium]